MASQKDGTVAATQAQTALREELLALLAADPEVRLAVKAICVDEILAVADKAPVPADVRSAVVGLLHDYVRPEAMRHPVPTR